MENVTFDEMKQMNMDFYINLLRIKKAQQGENTELDYQIRVQEAKLHALGIPTDNLQM